jgi:hypothetical protein
VWRCGVARTAPLSALMPLDSVHEAKSMPIVLIAPGIVAGPVMPMVRKLSNSASGIMGKNAALVYDSVTYVGRVSCTRWAASVAGAQGI